MEFCIGLDLYFRQHGFNTENWRKSVDGTKVIVHSEYAKLLIPGFEVDENVTCYEYPSQELNDILNSSEWFVPRAVR